MKKLSLALATAGLTASLGAYAALPTDSAPYQLVVPNIKSGISITLEGLLLRPSNSDLDYADFRNITLSDNTANALYSNIQTVDPDYNFGFRVGLGYVFPDSGNDVQIAWTHFSHTDSDTSNVPNGVASVSNLGHATFVDNTATDLEKAVSVDFFSPIYDSASVVGSAKFKLDSIDVNVGQYVDMGTRLRTRLFGGLRFAQVTNDQTATTNAVGSFEVVNIELEDVLKGNYSEVNVEQFNSKFSGVGPQVGIDTSYHIGNCFGVAAHAAVALLVGDTESNSSGTNTYSQQIALNDVINTDDTFTSVFDTYSNSDDVTRIVPALDAKLGLNWSYIFSNQSVFSAELGYQWTQYIDAVDKLTNDDFGNVVRTTSSVGFDGPYLTLNWSV